MKYTVPGFLSVILWSTVIGLSRSLIEMLGPFTAAAAMFTGGGALGLVYLAVQKDGLRKVGELPGSYLLGCGLLFVVYQFCLCLSIALADGHRQVLEVGVINYLWPGLTLAFSVFILKKKAKVTLALGIVIAFAGVWLAAAGPNVSAFLNAFLNNIRANPKAYGLALAAALSWALYSNLSRHWAGGAPGNAVPLFLLATGLMALVFRFVLEETSTWNARIGWEVVYMAVGPSLLAYAFWDLSMRKGHMTLVASFSYLTPLLSTAVTCIYLSVVPGWNVWVACIMVISGAIVCAFSVSK